MKTNDLKWNSVETLPMNEEQYKKVLLLSEGRLSGSTSLYISTDYWQVFFDERDFDLESVFDKKKRLGEGCIAYGRFGERKIPLEKIKGWMYADDLIGLYNGKR
jgi:hypothetical protein